MIDVLEFVRPNILKLKPYSSARSEFDGEADVFLDANENPFETGYNRYPDPLQYEVKERISRIKEVSVEQIFLGNGSDEVIDLLIRIFCEPGIDQIITLPPTYGMYKVSADIANVGIIEVPLDEAFQPDVDAILNAQTTTTKILFICHPNNPTANDIQIEKIETLVERFRGIVMIDEAYIDFSLSKSGLSLLQKYPNLVVSQTFSKAWGLAGIRLGMAFASEQIIGLFNKVKPPYNINQLTQTAAINALNQLDKKELWVHTILNERQQLEKQLAGFDFIQKIHPSAANFLLVKVSDPDGLYQHLLNEKIIVRNRSNVLKCEGCLRITIGLPEENIQLIRSLQKYAK